MRTIVWCAQQDSRFIAPETTDDVAERIAALRARLIRQARWYYAPLRLWRAFVGLLFSVVVIGQASAVAAPMTPCNGSYDGAGMTLCEILGVPGIVGGVGYTPFASLPLPMVIAYTAHHNGRLTTTDVGLKYTDDEGVEDLPDGDFDYNDHVVEWIIPGEPDPRGHEPDPIPEPAVLALLGSGALLSRYMRRHSS
jgi:hypothetical protein